MKPTQILHSQLLAQTAALLEANNSISFEGNLITVVNPKTGNKVKASHLLLTEYEVVVKTSTLQDTFTGAAPELIPLKDFSILEVENLLEEACKKAGKPFPDPQWVIVPDDAVIHVWKDKETNEEVEIDPSFYQDNGTPIDDQGDDCEYLHTKVLLPKI